MTLRITAPSSQMHIVNMLALVHIDAAETESVPSHGVHNENFAFAATTATFSLGWAIATGRNNIQHRSNNVRAVQLISDASRFELLATQWHTERGISSSTTEIVLCPSYQLIVGMGSKALPFIFGKLRSEGDRPDQWFWALRNITGEDPVPSSFRGNRRAMSKFWLEWAEQNGYAD